MSLLDEIKSIGKKIGGYASFIQSPCADCEYVFQISSEEKAAIYGWR